MDKKDDIETLFERLNTELDVKEPETGHQMRFLDKLKTNNVALKKGKTIGFKWQKIVVIAASLLLFIAVGFNVMSNSKQSGTAQMPEKMQNAQYHFASLIEFELEKINKQVTPDTKQLVEDTMLQLNKIEDDYKILENKIVKNGNTKQLLHAMIKNFQVRIDLLQDVLIKIENVKKIKYELTSV